MTGAYRPPPELQSAIRAPVREKFRLKAWEIQPFLAGSPSTLLGTGRTMIDLEITEREELAADTLERIREALTGSETACVGQIIDIIRKMSDKADTLSIQDLAEAIGHDMTTMVKVMKAANCLQFNPSALEVSTVARAVSVIGFNKIQNLALSLMLLEGAENRVNSAEGREVSGQALCSALLAEEVIRALSLADPEEAFVCAALRNYGRLLLSTFLVEEYRHAMAMTQTTSPDKAFRLTFGLTPLEVSQRILGEVRLSGIGPEMFLPASPSLLHCKHPGTEESLLVAAEFAAAFSELVSSPELKSDDYERKVAQLMEVYATPLTLNPEMLKGMIETVRTRLESFGRAEGYDAFSSVLMQRIKHLADGTSFHAVEKRRTEAKAAAPGTDFLFSPARGPLASAVKKMKRLLEQSPVDVHQIFGVAATTTRKVLKLESCVVFVRDPNGTHYSACSGDGSLFGRIEGRPLINPGNRDVFTVCLSQGEDVLIQDPAESRIAPFVPEWFREALHGGSFVLLPVKDSDGVFGVICGVARPGNRIELGISRLPQFRGMRALLNQLRSLAGQKQAA